MAAALLATVFAGATPALAQTSASAATPAAAPVAKVVAVLTVGMQLDCVNMTADVHKYAVDHNFCPGSGMVPDNEVVGDCGKSHIYVLNDGFSTAFFEWGFYSFEGAVAFRNLTISYTIGGGGASFGDVDGMLSAAYENSSTRYTGSGQLYAAMDGTVALWWGGICSVLHPTDNEWISASG